MSFSSCKAEYLAGHVVQKDAEGARRSLAEAGFPVPDEGEAERVEDIDELDELQEAAAKEARPLASTRRAQAAQQGSTSGEPARKV